MHTFPNPDSLKTDAFLATQLPRRYQVYSNLIGRWTKTQQVQWRSAGFRCTRRRHVSANSYISSCRRQLHLKVIACKPGENPHSASASCCICRSGASHYCAQNALHKSAGCTINEVRLPKQAALSDHRVLAESPFPLRAVYPFSQRHDNRCLRFPATHTSRQGVWPSPFAPYP